MKITKKILENIVKQETAKVLNRKPINEWAQYVIPYLAKGAGAFATALGAEVVFSRVASALGLDQDDGKDFEAYLDIRERDMYRYITRQTNRSLKKANEIIANHTARIKELEEMVENLQFNKSVDTDNGAASK
jgi:hypothetical protein